MCGRVGVWQPTPRTADVTVTKIAGYGRVRILTSCARVRSLEIVRILFEHMSSQGSKAVGEDYQHTGVDFEP